MRRVSLVMALASLIGLVGRLVPAEASTSVDRPDSPSVAMTCGAGQFDINFGAAEEVVSSLGLDYDVARRLVAQRPWYAPDDLLTVPGVGPGWLEDMKSQGRLCATPATTPPPSMDVCTRSLVDVQTASLNELQGFGLSTNAARNLISARPFAALRQIVPERVPALGRSAQKALQSRGCLTPATITTSTTTWRWAYANTTTLCTRGFFALSVPAGTIIAEPGAWLSISDVAEPVLLGGPTADFHIWGPWENGLTSAQVTGPADDRPADAEGEWVDMVMHFSGEGALFSGPGATRVNSDGTVTTAVESLSIFTWVKVPLSFIAVVGKAIFSALEWVEGLVRWYIGISALTPGCNPDITAHELISTTGTALESTDPLGDWNSVPIKYCVGAPGARVGEWRLANNLGAVIELYSPGASVVARAPSGDLLTDLLFDAKGFTSSRILLPPGGVASVRVAQGHPRAEVSVTLADNASILQAFIARSLGRLDIRAAEAYSLLNDCAWGNIVNFAEISALLKCAATGGLLIAEELSKVLAVAFVAFDVIVQDVESLELGLTPRNLLLKYFNQASASQPSDGTIGNGSLPPGQMRILKRPGSSASYLLDSNGVAHHIQDGGTYICLAQYWPVRFNLDDVEFAAMVSSFGASASCPPSAGEVRELLRSNSDGFLLRKSNGSTYLIRDGGYRVPVFSGYDHFNCLAADHEVWDYAQDPEELERFPQHPWIVATGCSDGELLQG